MGFGVAELLVRGYLAILARWWRVIFAATWAACFTATAPAAQSRAGVHDPAPGADLGASAGATQPGPRTSTNQCFVPVLML